MNTLRFLLKLPVYEAFKFFELPVVPMPLAYVYFLTTRCNSKCINCNLWKTKPNPELNTNQWLKIIEGIGSTPVWITMTGGEPFLKEGFDEILSHVLRFNQPRVVCIPTNGSMPKLIVSQLKTALKVPGNYEIIVNISVDEVGERHDELRGLKGNFSKLKQTIRWLKELQTQDARLKIGVNTVISQANIARLYKIYDYVTRVLQPDDYIFETAQQRFELKTGSKRFGIDKQKLEHFLKQLIKENKRQVIHKRFIGFIKTLIRIRYYHHILNPKPQRCNAGILSCYIMPNGDVIACGVLGDKIANISKYGLDMKKLWRSPTAKSKRAKFRKRKCSCELAALFYINQL